MNQFTEKVIKIIGDIPSGQVSTYGFIAASAGSPGGARQVARILHSSSKKHRLPWHRVVNRNGEISPRGNMSHLTQRQMLEEEGVEFDCKGRIDFTEYLWLP